jgi:hypothetical protein
MSKSFFAGCVGALLVLWSSATAAQSFEPVPVAASAPACLANPAGPAPELPPLFGKESAVIRVELTFTEPDQPPSIGVTFRKGVDDAARIVREHVARSRWPCLAKGHVVTAIQEFQFVPGTPGRVIASEPLVTELKYGEMLDCTAQIRSLRPPALDFGLEGNRERVIPGKVMVEITFSSPDDAPEIKVLFGDWNRSLVEVVRRGIISAYRLPCASPQNKVVFLRYFHYDGPEPPPTKRLKQELTLIEFVGLLGDLKQYKNRFELDTMGCPFKVRFSPWMPYAANWVEELGAPNPNRQFFLKWLAGVTLNLPPEIMKTAAGEPTVVSVPCGLIDFSQ